MDTGGWLQSLGLERYEQAFRDNEIDVQVLPNLTGEDLKELGVSTVGHRRRLLDAIAALRTGTPSTHEAAVTTLPAGPESEHTGVAPSAERRQLTVMFCDLVGSTALASRLDPEDLREVLGAYHAAVAEVVTGFGGYVAKYMGDGVLAYFGYPQAHEHDAEQAVRAGLALVDRVGRLASSAGAVGEPGRYRHRPRRCRRSDRVGRVAGARGCRRDAESCRPSARNGAGERGAGRGQHAAAGWRSFRLSRSRGGHGEGAGRTGTGLRKC